MKCSELLLPTII